MLWLNRFICPVMHSFAASLYENCLLTTTPDKTKSPWGGLTVLDLLTTKVLVC